MLTKEVKQWLSEYKGLASAEVTDFAASLADNDKLLEGLYTLFEMPPYQVQELDPVCHQLYEFYRSKEDALRLFSLQFVATLVWMYLRSLSSNDKKVCGGVETFLLGVYNLEIVKSDGTPVVESFCIPTVSKASIYHESRIPGVTEPLTEHALRSLNPSQSMWTSGPFPQYERFNAQNRFSILTYVMQRYNARIDSFPKISREALCKAAINLSNTGFDMQNNYASAQQPRISVSPSLLVEFMVAVYFAMCNGQPVMAIKAVEATHVRASFELYSDVLLITNALLNSHRRGNFKCVNSEISIGVQRAMFMLKNSITNASFKAKKLPDDIEIVEDDDTTRLPTVDEDQEHSLAKGFKAKLLTIGKNLGVDKNKNRDTMRRDSDTSSMKSGSGMDLVDSVGVAVRNPSGKVIVDMLEMHPVRTKGGDDGEGVAGIYRNSYGEKSSEGKQIRISNSPIVFSKKAGVTRQSSHGTPATLNSEPPPKAQLTYTISSPSSMASPMPTSFSLSPNTINGKATSGSSLNSSTHSVVSSLKQTLLQSKANPSDNPRAQSEGPTREGSKSGPGKQPLSSSPSLLSSVSQSFPKNEEAGLHANLSEPALTQHSSLSPTPPPSSSTHSIPAEILTQNSSKASQKPLVNQNSCSTDL